MTRWGWFFMGPVLAAFAKTGYDKAIGLEYFPVEDAMAGLKALTETIPL